MRLVLLIISLAGLLAAAGATASALGVDPEGAAAAIFTEKIITAAQAETVEVNSIESGLRPAGELSARPVAQGGLAIVNGLEIQDPDPTCGVPFAVHVNVANQSGQNSLPGTLSLQNFHRGTESVNYTGSQSYPEMPPDGNYVLVFQVLVNSYVSEGQELVASTNGSSFRLKYDIDKGNCSETSGSTSPPSGTAQSFVVRHSGKCLDVPGGSKNSVTPVQQYSCTGNDNQWWSVISVGNGYYQIVSWSSGMCLDVKNFSQESQAIVQQYPCNGGDNQSFSFRSVSGGYNLIVAKHSGMCLDVRGASTADFAPIQQFSCHGDSNQQWQIR